MGSFFDSALVRTAALLLSVVMHAFVLALLIFADAPPEREVVRIEVYATAPPAAAKVSSVDEGAPPEPTDAPLAPAAAAVPPSADDAPRGYREVLAERERSFDLAMAARADRLAALERWRDTSGPATADDVEVRLCGARELGTVLVVTREKDMGRYASFVPTGLFPRAYTAGMTQVLGRRSGPRALGRYEFALPARAATVQLDDPSGTLFSIGRDDARCLIGFSWHPDDIFPLRFSHVPARFVDNSDRVAEVQLDVEVFADGTFTVHVREGDALPFARATLYDQKTVARNLSQHATSARVMKGLVESLFGG